MEEVAISAESITYRYQTEEIETTAVDSVSFHIKRGDYVAIEGPSGCGKSSLLSMLGLVQRPASGSLNFFGKELGGATETSRAEFRARELGMVFQSFHLIPELTVLDNLMLKLKYCGITEKKIAKSRSLEVLDKLGLDKRANHFPDQLSGGQQQRVALARALVCRPRILLADEPTGNLDSKSSDNVMNVMDDIHSAGMTIVMVTHNPAHAERASRRLGMIDGKLFEGVRHA